MKKSLILMVTILSLALLVGSTGLITFAATDDNTSSSNSDSAGKPQKERSGRKNGTHVNVIKVAASVLGQTEDEVKEAVKTGKVGDLLVEAGKVEDFKSAYLTELKSKLDEAVTAGTLTQAQADEKYASGQEKMDAYDGTDHLCGGKDHSKMFEKKSRSTSGGDSTSSANAAL